MAVNYYNKIIDLGLKYLLASLEWRHISFMAAQNKGKSTSTGVKFVQVDITKIPHYWSFYGAPPMSGVFPVQKGPAIQKASPFHDNRDIA